MLLSRYVPADSQEILQEETGHVVYLYNNRDNDPCAMAYGGKRKKNDWAYRFKNVTQRDEYVEKYLSDRIKVKQQKEQEKIDDKKRKEAEAKDVQVGDIFHCGWGYEQTQCDFYQVVSKKGITVELVEIGSKTVEGTQGHDCEYQQADPSRVIGEPFKKRLNGNSVKLSSFQYASKCKPDAQFYCSWYY